MTLAEFIGSQPKRTQAEWAEHFGLSRSYMCEILSGASIPGRKTIAKIAERTNGAVPPEVWFQPQGADAA